MTAEALESNVEARGAFEAWHRNQQTTFRQTLDLLSIPLPTWAQRQKPGPRGTVASRPMCTERPSSSAHKSLDSSSVTNCLDSSSVQNSHVAPNDDAAERRAVRAAEFAEFAELGVMKRTSAAQPSGVPSKAVVYLRGNEGEPACPEASEGFSARMARSRAERAAQRAVLEAYVPDEHSLNEF